MSSRHSSIDISMHVGEFEVEVREFEKFAILDLKLSATNISDGQLHSTGELTLFFADKVEATLVFAAFDLIKAQRKAAALKTNQKKEPA